MDSFLDYQFQKEKSEQQKRRAHIARNAFLAEFNWDYLWQAVQECKLHDCTKKEWYALNNSRVLITGMSYCEHDFLNVRVSKDGKYVAVVDYDFNNSVYILLTKRGTIVSENKLTVGPFVI